MLSDRETKEASTLRLRDRQGGMALGRPTGCFLEEGASELSCRDGRLTGWAERGRRGLWVEGQHR